jgi:hypothetical protein
MDVVLSLGGSGAPTTVVVSGVLDVTTTSEFSQLIFGLHDILGPDAGYDFRPTLVGDEAGRSTLALIAHKFREFGRSVELPPGLEVAAPLVG